MAADDRNQRIALFSVLIAALAAIGSLGSAIYAAKSVGLQAASTALDRSPVLQLSCRNQFRALDPNMPHTAFLLGLSANTLPIDLTTHIPIYDAEGHIITAPMTYIRCTLTNFGRLPVTDIQLTITANFWVGKPFHSASSSVPNSIDVPGLSSEGSFEFMIVNNETLPMSIGFARQASAVRVDTAASATLPILVDHSTTQAEAFVVNGAAKPLILKTPPPSMPAKSKNRRP